MIESKSGKLEWFGGNQDALNMYRMLVDLVQIWDDLVDKDKEVPESDINYAFLIALAYMPANPFYSLIQKDVLPMWIISLSAYEVANKFERDKDEKGLEISHNLRFAAGHVVAYMVHMCLGYEKAKDIMPEVWKTIVDQRFQDYRKEHLNALA
jgi:hypothetical protein